jgi:hypothetical protein
MRDNELGAETAREVVRGEVVEYNLSPRGCVEGVLVRRDGRVVQVNFPPDAGVALARAGQQVEIPAEPEPPGKKHPAGEHPVYRAVTGGPDRGPRHGPRLRVEGVVRRVNFARHGEPNGVVLDSGDFVHLKPEGMRQSGLAVGAAVKAEGPARPMALGGQVIEAEVVNGVRVGHKA